MSRPAISMLVACVIGIFFSVVPLFVSGMSMLTIPITKAMGWSRGQVSELVGVGLISLALTVPLVGRLIAAIGARRVIIPSTALFAASLFAFAHAPSFGSALAFAVGVGVFGAGASQFAYVIVLPLWFDRRLGLALGIAMLGIGLGTILVPLTVEMLARTHSWREIFVFMAAAVLCIAFPSALLLLRTPPTTAMPGGRPRSARSGDLTLGQAIRGRMFWQLGLSIFIATMTLTGLGLQFAGLLTDRGFHPAEIAHVFSLWGVSLLVGRLAGGALLDHLDARVVGGLCLLSACFGAALLASGATGLLVVASIIMLGVGHGMDGDLLPYMARRYFGARSYSTIFGSLGMAFSLGPAVGAILVGKAFDYFGSYTPLLWTISGAMLVSTLLLVTMGSAPPFAAASDDAGDADALSHVPHTVRTAS